MGEDIWARVSQLEAEMRAHQLMAEVVLHGLCFEVEAISRTRLLDLMEMVHQELVTGLSAEDAVVQAFAEQKKRYISLLVGCLIQASVQS